MLIFLIVNLFLQISNFSTTYQIFAKLSAENRTVPLADNVVVASRRRGHRWGSDESKRWCYLLCVRRVCTPACV